MTRRTLHILFVCTGNSARSIMAEAIASAVGRGRIEASSAGSHPKGAVHPLAIETLRRRGLSVAALRSKGWDEFARAGARPVDRVVTLCDEAAREACPAWPGRAAAEHWSIPDPAAASGTDEARRQAFDAAFEDLDARIRALLARADLGPVPAKPR